MMATLNLDMTFDFICPWCLIGKRNLDAALRLLARQRPELDVRVNWLGLQLLPQVPMEGEPFAAFYQRRLGGKRAVRARQMEVRDAARQAGVEIDFERIRSMPNTTYAHRVFQRAAQLGSHSQLERLLEQASYDAADKDGTSIEVTAEFVDRHLGALAKDEDLSRYIL